MAIRDNARRTYDSPTGLDDWSFFGRGRVRIQRFNANRLGQPEPDSPPKTAVPQKNDIGV